MMMMLISTLLLFAADCGWNVTKALNTCRPVIAANVPGAASTNQHCIVSSSMAQQGAVSQASATVCSQADDTVIDRDVLTEKLTEKGWLVIKVNFLLSFAN